MQTNANFTSQVTTSTSFNFNFMLPAWTTISSLDGSTFRTVTFLLREDTCTISPILGILTLPPAIVNRQNKTTYHN